MWDSIGKLVGAFVNQADIGHLVLAMCLVYFAWLLKGERARVDVAYTEKYNLAVQHIEATAQVNLVLEQIRQTVHYLGERLK